jgi:membrane peptidoglycan carboxypeptidase
LALGFAALAGTALAAASLTTPAVGDAAARVASLDARHGSIPVAVADTAPIAVAVVASEDGRFYSHHGVDLIGVARALAGRLTGTDAGGSTLDQQLAAVR